MSPSPLHNTMLMGPVLGQWRSSELLCISTAGLHWKAVLHSTPSLPLALTLFPPSLLQCSLSLKAGWEVSLLYAQAFCGPLFSLFWAVTSLCGYHRSLRKEVLWLKPRAALFYGEKCDLFESNLTGTSCPFKKTAAAVSPLGLMTSPTGNFWQALQY